MRLFNNTNMRTAMAYTNAVGDKVYPVIVDIKKGIKSTEEILFVSSDINTGVLSVAFIQGNDTYNVEGAEVICSIMRPDTTTLEIPCNVINGNTIEVPLGVNGTSQDGIYSFDFKVFKGGNKVVGTPIMNYSVSLSISNDNAVLEDDRLPVLTMLMTQVNELHNTTRETINQANTATEATKVATANAIEATNNANAVSERVSQETATTISEIKQDTANAIANVNATSDTMVENVNNAISSMDTTVNSKISEMTDAVNNKISEVNTAKNDMINDVSSTKANMVTEVTNAKNEMTATVTNKVNEVEGRFNALTASQQQSSEVIDARDGETSLKTRLDRDIEKAKQVYVNVEGSYISTDSSDGYAKNIEILGNTIQDSENLADIRSVGDTVEGQELYEIPVLSVGKNIWNTTISIFNNNKYLCTPNYSREVGVKLPKNSSWTLSFEKITRDARVYIWGGNNSVREVNPNISNKVSFTLNGDEDGISFYAGNFGNSPYDEITTDFKIQLEEGTQATPYEPYVEDKLTILSPTQLEKVGDVCDSIIEKDGVWGVEKHIKTDLLKGGGNEDFRLNKVLDKGGYQFTWFANMGAIANKNSEVISSTMNSYVGSNEEYSSNMWIYNGITYVIHHPTISTKDEIKLWLQANPTIVKFASNTPQFIPLPHSQQVKLRTFANKTNISFGCEIEGMIKAQVPRSIGATVNTHTEQINNLNKELDRVKKLEESTVSTVTTESAFTTVEQTSNGYFEDVKLEGKTLVNIYPKVTPALSVSDRDNLKYNVIKKEGYIKVTGSDLEATNYRYINMGRVNFEMFKPNTTYTVVFTKFKGSSRITIQNGNSQHPIVKGGSINAQDNKLLYTFVTTETLVKSEQILYLWVDPKSTTVDVEAENPMIFEGDLTANPPSGYIEGLKSVGQDVDEISVESVNENLIKLNSKIINRNGITYEFKDDGSIIANGTATGLSEIYLPVLGSDKIDMKIFNEKTVTLSGCPKDGGSNKYRLGIVSNEPAWKNINDIGNGCSCVITSKDGNEWTIRLTIYSGQTVNNLVFLPKLQFGSNISNYQPHQSDKKRLLYYNEETQTWEKPILRQWDSIEKHANGKYYYHQRSAEEVLNGSGNVRFSYDSVVNTRENENNKTSIYFGFSVPNCVTITFLDSPLVISDKFPSYSRGAVQNEVTNGICNNMGIRVSKSVIGYVDGDTTDVIVQKLNTWLQTNNVTVVHQLAEEKVYECTNIDLITYANETNFIVESGAIAPKSILKVHNNISNVVKILQQKVSLLENKFIEGLKKVLAGDMYSLAELLYPEDFVEENPENNIMLLPLE